MRTTANVLRLLPVGLAVTALACGGSSSSSSPAAPTLTSAVQTTTITITAAGVSPNNIEVSQGARVLFINNDTRSHNMTSDPHPEHTDCPPINSVGFLAPGQQIETSNLTTVRTCGFHDHDDPSNTKFQGRITIK
jgi:plastocyanin